MSDPTRPESAPDGHADGLRLLADVGASNLRFALDAGDGRPRIEHTLACAGHASLEAAVRAFLRSQGDPPLRHAAFSLPNPIDGDRVQLTNHPWSFSVEAMRRALGLQTLLVMNDYTALAMGLTRLDPSQRHKVGGGEPVAGGIQGVIGPGSGLGVSALLPVQDRYIALASEGGHASYPPQTEAERWVVAAAEARFGHASGERLISGPGLELIHATLRAHRLADQPALGDTPAHLSAPEIAARAQAEPPCPLAHEALSMFCAMFGTAAGNLALTLGATGGLSIGGGIVPQMLGFFERSAFRARFEAKGRFQPWLARIPTWVVTAPQAALSGVSAFLDDHLSADHGAQPLLDDVRAALDRLSTSERLVAQDLLSAPRAWMSDPIARIAARCGVSTPTVMRFCRTMGFKGLVDFKLRLGAGLSGTTKVAHRSVRAEDPTAERIATILNNSISALITLRDRLHPQAFEQAVQLLAQARRIEVYGVGAAALAAEEAQHKFGRVGLHAVARTDPALQALTSVYLGAQDVLLVLSNSGRIDAMNEAVARARRGGTPVIAMCPQRSDLARLADVVLPVDHPEDQQALVPMVSRLMQTVIIDVLVTDLALQRRDLIGASLALQPGQRFAALSSHGG